jgi:hypothetical protein
MEVRMDRNMAERAIAIAAIIVLASYFGAHAFGVI